jgi:hypothetical protein
VCGGDSQTELLQALYVIAESNQQRATEVERATSSMKERLAALEWRLTKVELPPAA